ncbi:MAG: hypothetical protein WCT08_01950 [Patescibacteria group bacterium]|jgi:hypothetical protein
MKIFIDKSQLFYKSTLIVVFLIAAFYRLYQPLKFQALTQFDIFDWAMQSKQILLSGQAPLHSLFIFPLFNAFISMISGINLFYVYLLGGGIITLITFLVLYQILILLFENKLARLLVLLIYATAVQLLPRSIMYLPETLSYLVGMYLVYLFIKLFKDQKLVYLLLILVCNYLYFHLHQSGLNFIFFSLVTIFLYFLFSQKYKIKSKILIFIGLLVFLSSILFFNKDLFNSFKFFLTQSNNTDTAFNGDAIPISRFLTNYSFIFLLPLFLGIIYGFVNLFKKIKTSSKLSFIIILVITLFYFSFLYILPNLNLYSLIPWRFYTWFTLYTIILLGYGFDYMFTFFENKKVLQYFFFSVLFLFTIPGGLVFDNMFTADFKTLDAMSKLYIQNDSMILTTNANYLQIRYALLGNNYIITQDGPQLFKIPSSKEAYDYIKGTYKNTNIYVLISLYQIKQRPSAIDYWRNSAIYDMNLKVFDNTKYFSKEYSDSNIVLYKIAS